jgi:hypothetical protein
MGVAGAASIFIFAGLAAVSRTCCRWPNFVAWPCACSFSLSRRARGFDTVALV